MDAEVLKAVSAVAAKHNWPAHYLAAVTQVESGGVLFATVKGRQEPLIRWEGHYFDRLLADRPALQKQARDLGLASPKAGGIPNPTSQARRYEMLEKAMKIDAAAALSSCSWGAGQVMGSHWRSLGYASPQELAEAARSGAEGQVELMAKFIVANGLEDELRRGDWAGFARGYNGPNYRVNNYDEKMRAAARDLEDDMPPSGLEPPPARPVLRMGDKGTWVRLAQTFLPVTADGDFGPKTKAAVQEWQRAHGLSPDGVIGGKTWASFDSKE